MVNCEKRNVSDDAAQLDLHEPVLGGYEGGKVIQETQCNTSLVRFEKGAYENFNTGQREPDGYGGGFVHEQVLADVHDVGKVRASMFEPRGQAVAAFNLESCKTI